MSASGASILRIDQVQDWNCEIVAVDPSLILRVHKYRDIKKVRKAIVRAAELASKSAASLSRICGKYIVKRIDGVETGRLTMASGGAFHCAAFDRHMRGCAYLLVFVITLGPRLDRHVAQQLIEDNFVPLDALFLETAGWLSIESATRTFARQMKRELIKHQFGVSLRMGPGYDYSIPGRDDRARWKLEEQRTLFDLFGNTELPVSLMASCAMIPKMSRSGVFGLRPASQM